MDRLCLHDLVHTVMHHPCGCQQNGIIPCRASKLRRGASGVTMCACAYASRASSTRTATLGRGMRAATRISNSASSLQRHQILVHNCIMRHLREKKSSTHFFWRPYRRSPGKNFTSHGFHTIIHACAYFTCYPVVYSMQITGTSVRTLYLIGHMHRSSDQLGPP